MFQKERRPTLLLSLYLVVMNTMIVTGATSKKPQQRTENILIMFIHEYYSHVLFLSFFLIHTYYFEGWMELKLVFRWKRKIYVLVVCLVKPMPWWDMFEMNIAIADGHTIIVLSFSPLLVLLMNLTWSRSIDV